MMHPTLAGIGLVRLGDSGFVPVNMEDDLCGKDVHDPHGQRMGRVEELYVDRQKRGEVRYLEVGSGGFLGIGEGHFLVPVEAVTRVSEDRVTVEPDRTEKVDGPAPFDNKVRPLSADDRRNDDHASPPIFDNAEGTADHRGDIHALFSRSVADSSSRTAVRMKAAPTHSVRPETHKGGGSSGAAWGVTGLMAKDILPEGPAERRRRGRLYALRAVDRLGLLGEGNLLATLAARPHLRWLADEEGARWAVLAHLGRIGDPGAFEEAVEWALQNRPSPEEAAAHVRRLRSGPHRPDAPRPGAYGSLARRTEPSVPRLVGATGKDERRC